MVGGKNLVRLLMSALLGLNGVVVAVLTLLKEGGCCYFFVGVVVGVDFRDIPAT